VLFDGLLQRRPATNLVCGHRVAAED
jgi:hypothetical protein